MDTIETYKSYAQKIGNRESIYEAVKKKYDIKSALYPGSHIDITPSLYIPEVTYVDNFKGTIKFFKEIDVIKEFIEKNKLYKEETIINFIGEDYSKVELDKKYDLIISQYAGFVGRETKEFLRAGGYLLCNDSHGDATLAYFDDDYEFIGIVNRKCKITSTNIDKYFKLKNSKKVDLEKVIKTMKGPKYVHHNENYIFRLNSKKND